MRRLGFAVTYRSRQRGLLLLAGQDAPDASAEPVGELEDRRPVAKCVRRASSTPEVREPSYARLAFEKWLAFPLKPSSNVHWRTARRRSDQFESGRGCEHVHADASAALHLSSRRAHRTGSKKAGRANWPCQFGARAPQRRRKAVLELVGANRAQVWTHRAGASRLVLAGELLRTEVAVRSPQRPPCGRLDAPASQEAGTPRRRPRPRRECLASSARSRDARGAAGTRCLPVAQGTAGGGAGATRRHAASTRSRRRGWVRGARGPSAAAPCRTHGARLRQAATRRRARRRRRSVLRSGRCMGTAVVFAERGAVVYNGGVASWWSGLSRTSMKPGVCVECGCAAMTMSASECSSRRPAATSGCCCVA